MKNDHIQTPWKHTSRGNWRDKELEKWNEEDIRYHSPIESMLKKEVQLFICALWGSILYYCMTFGDSIFDTVMMWFSLAIVVIFGGMFLCLNAKPFLKWLFDVVTYPVK